MCFSIVYAIAPLTFCVLFVALVTGGISLALSGSTLLRISISIGISLGLCIAVVEVYTSGKIMEAAFRPWGAADQLLQGGKTKKKGAIFVAPDEEGARNCPELHIFLEKLGLLEFEAGLNESGLTFPLLCKVAREIKCPSFLDSTLRSAGVQNAGHRCRMLLRILERSTAAQTSELGTK